MGVFGLQFPIRELQTDTKDALQGTSGEPSDLNRFVTKADVATPANTGLMSSTDKSKLDALNTDSVLSTRQIISGAGLTGGGDLSADRTLDIVAANGTITVNANSIQVGVITATEHGDLAGGTLHALSSGSTAGFMSAAQYTKLDGLPTSAVPTGRTLTAGAGMTGGGTLAADRTFDVVAADGSIVVNADSIQVGVISDANHGQRSGGNLHSVATVSVAGFMSAADKTKLDTALTTAPGSGTVNEVDFDTYRTRFDTTSTAWQLYRTFTTATLGEWIYRFGWTYQCTGSSTSTQVMVEVRLDGVAIDQVMVTPRQANDRISQGGFIYKDFTGLGSSTHTLSIYVSSGASGKQASVYQSDMEVWRSNVA